jgi:prefoldin subunit 5
MRLAPILGVLVALSVVLAAFGFYESSRYSAETGVANGLSAQISTLSAATFSYSTEASTLSSASASLRGQLVQVQANVTSQVTIRNSLQAQISQLNANVTSLTTSRDSLQGQLTQANANVTSLRSQVSTLNSEISTLNGQASTLTSQVSSLDGQITSLTSQTSTFTTQIASDNGQIASLNSKIASLTSQVSTLTTQVASYQSLADLSVRTTLINSSSFSVPTPPAGECEFVSLLSSGYTADSGGYLLITGTTNSTLSYAFVTFPAPLSETVAYYLGTTAATPIAITPGNVVVHLDNCGPTPMSATLTVEQVT